MSFGFAADGTPIDVQVRRIATKRFDNALAVLASGSDRAAAIHVARKDLKKVRGLIRLVQPAFPDGAAENRSIRLISRMMAQSRTAAAMLETWNRLMARYGAGLDAGALQPLHEDLQTELAQAHDEDLDLAPIRAALEQARTRATDWTLTASGFAAFEGGVKKTYGRAAAAMKKARESRADEDFHDWRKQVKYHWYHARLLGPAAPAKMSGRIADAARLNDILGDHHDLIEFGPALAQAGLSDGARNTLTAVVQAEVARLESAAFEIGPRLFAKAPKDIGRRWKKWWRRAAG